MGWGTRQGDHAVTIAVAIPDLAFAAILCVPSASMQKDQRMLSYDALSAFHMLRSKVAVSCSVMVKLAKYDRRPGDIGRTDQCVLKVRWW